MQPVSARIAQALNVAAQARLVLAGRKPPGGFWTCPATPAARRVSSTMQCWRENMARARRLRVEGR